MTYFDTAAACCVQTFGTEGLCEYIDVCNPTPLETPEPTPAPTPVPTPEPTPEPTLEPTFGSTPTVSKEVTSPPIMNNDGRGGN